jgi:hypothetical protein
MFRQVSASKKEPISHTHQIFLKDNCLSSRWPCQITLHFRHLSRSRVIGQMLAVSGTFWSLLDHSGHYSTDLVIVNPAAGTIEESGG